MNGLGVRQRRVLYLMLRFGGGRWPPSWSMSYPDRGVISALHRKGMVDSAGRDATLTELGTLTASRLNGKALPFRTDTW